MIYNLYISQSKQAKSVANIYYWFKWIATRSDKLVHATPVNKQLLQIYTTVMLYAIRLKKQKT